MRPARRKARISRRNFAHEQFAREKFLRAANEFGRLGHTGDLEMVIRTMARQSITHPQLPRAYQIAGNACLTLARNFGRQARARKRGPIRQELETKRRRTLKRAKEHFLQGAWVAERNAVRSENEFERTRDLVEKGLAGHFRALEAMLKKAAEKAEKLRATDGI